MKRSATKKRVLYVSGAYSVFLLTLFLSDSFCHSSWCRVNVVDLLGMVVIVLVPLLPIFFFSLITYFAREEVFRAWWNFARWWVSTIFVGTIFCILMPSDNGFISYDALIYFFILAPLYTILILGSLWKLIREYFKWHSISFKW